MQKQIIAKNPKAKGANIAVSLLAYYRSSLIESVIHAAKKGGEVKSLIEALPQKVQNGIQKQIQELKKTDDTVKKALKKNEWDPSVFAKAAKNYRPKFNGKVEQTDQRLQTLFDQLKGAQTEQEKAKACHHFYKKVTPLWENTSEKEILTQQATYDGAFSIPSWYADLYKESAKMKFQEVIEILQKITATPNESAWEASSTFSTMDSSTSTPPTWPQPSTTTFSSYIPSPTASTSTSSYVPSPTASTSTTSFRTSRVPFAPIPPPIVRPTTSSRPAPSFTTTSTTTTSSSYVPSPTDSTTPPSYASRTPFAQVPSSPAFNYVPPSIPPRDDSVYWIPTPEASTSTSSSDVPLQDSDASYWIPTPGASPASYVPEATATSSSVYPSSTSTSAAYFPSSQPQELATVDKILHMQGNILEDIKNCKDGLKEATVKQLTDVMVQIQRMNQEITQMDSEMAQAMAVGQEISGNDKIESLLRNKSEIEEGFKDLEALSLVRQYSLAHPTEVRQNAREARNCPPPCKHQSGFSALDFSDPGSSRN